MAGFEGLTYANLGTPAGNAHFMRQMLKTTHPKLLMQNFFKKYKLPKRQGDTAVFWRVRQIAPATTPLAEGILPKPVEVHFEELSVKINYYGSWTKITRQSEDLSPIDVFEKVTERLGDQMAETFELINWNTACSGSNVHYPGAVTARSSVSTAIDTNGKVLKKATQQLQVNQAKLFMKQGKKASDKVGTGPTLRGWGAFAHPYVEYDLQQITGGGDLSGWRPTEAYGGGQEDILNAFERGQVHRTIFFMHPRMHPFKASGADSSTCRKTGSKTDVYPIPIMGMNALSCIALTGYRGGNKKGASSNRWDNDRWGVPSGEMMTTRPRDVSKSDPMGLYGTAAWIDTYAAFIENDAWLTRVEAGVTSV